MKKKIGILLILLGGLIITISVLFVSTFFIIQYRGLAHEDYTRKFFMINFGMSLIFPITGYLLVIAGRNAMKGQLSGTDLKRRVWGICLLFLGLMFLISAIVNCHLASYGVMAAHVTVFILSIWVINMGIKKIKMSSTDTKAVSD